ncbi:hypothetical protein D3C77_708490 [compost metagenome]
MGRQDVGHLGHFFGSNAALLEVVSDHQACDRMEGLELGWRQVNRCQRVHQLIVHTGEPPGLVYLEDVCHDSSR